MGLSGTTIKVSGEGSPQKGLPIPTVEQSPVEDLKYLNTIEAKVWTNSKGEWGSTSGLTIVTNSSLKDLQNILEEERKIVIEHWRALNEAFMRAMTQKR